jgi:HNH endonuclease
MDAATRELVRRRAAGRCEYCRLPDEADEWPFHVEHIVPRQHSGDNGLENLCWACSRCNLHKGPNLVSIDTESGQVVSLFNPRLEEWIDHFSIVDARIMGLTTTGRVTVQLLRMNDARRIALRHELIEQGNFTI